MGKIASKNSVRQELNCIAFFGDKVIATDSFRAIEVTVSGGERLEKPVLLNANTVQKRVKMDKSETMTLEQIRTIAQLEPVDETYPDVEEVMNKAESNDCISMTINGRYLAEMVTLLSGLNLLNTVTLKIPKEPSKPLIIEADGYMKGRGVLMPMNK